MKDSGLTKAEDLDGKKIGFFYGHISTDVLRNLLRKEGIEYEEVNVGFDYSQLVSGKVDAEWAFRVTAGLNLPEKGIDVNVISPADYRINTHGYTIFTTEEMIKEHPETVRKFLKATIKGIGHTLDYPSEAIDILAARSTKLNRDMEYKRLLMYNEVTSNSERYPIGYMDYKMFKETYGRLLEEGVIEREFDVSDAYTTEFLEEIY